MSSLCEGNGSRDCFVDGLTPKKVWFRDKDDVSNKNMFVDRLAKPTISWKDKLLGNFPKDPNNETMVDDDFDFLEGDVKKSIVDGIPPIDFSERIHRQLIKDLKIIVILKLMGRNIGFSILNNKIYSLWKPSLPI
ncbi:hypothetical protein Goari_006353 [Gossypium aridum]|uniref:Uncharacterized protein n=1 Tax=Gossypium aridum TaxID=34290 RepID=A0A7J8XMN0_GOSAI|nr:hypothetical protein [Gossypium aridum]